MAGSAGSSALLSAPKKLVNVANAASQATSKLLISESRGEVIAPAKRDALETAIAVARQQSLRARIAMTAPFAHTYEYQQAMLWRSWARTHYAELIDTRRAVVLANKKATEVSSALNTDVARVWERAGIGDVAAGCLASGATLALAGGAVGLALGPLGMIVGAAAGFVIGCILGLIPFEKMAALDNWHAVLKALTPFERCLVLAHVRDWADDACRAERQPVWPVWRWGWAAMPLGHTLFGDRRSFSIFLSEIAFEELGEGWPSDGTWPQYATAWLVGGHEDDLHVDQARTMVGHVRSGKGPSWLRAYVERDVSAGLTCGEVRARALAAGVADFNQLPETHGLAELAGTAQVTA